MNKDSKIFVAGHKGLVGSAIVKKLQEDGYTNIITADRRELDLTNQWMVNAWFGVVHPEYVFDAAAKVGGIYANDHYSGDFIYQNLAIQTNLIHAAYQENVKKFLFLGSVCIYPKFAETPVKESSLLTGELEPTNEAYAIAKISGIKMLEAYHKQYGFKSVSLMPANLYGPRDNFHPQNGHVIPALLTKMTQSPDKVVMWGDGTARREFLFSEDLADAAVFMMNQSFTDDAKIYNVGSGFDISIKGLSDILVRVLDYKGTIEWDTSKPNGTPKRPLDYTKITALGWKPKHTFEEGLHKTYEWFKENQ
jgi:GDP-L-fucose synthase